MSEEGKFLRGLKWYGHRNVDGEFPEEISRDEIKMADIQFYLDNPDLLKKEGEVIEERIEETVEEDTEEEEKMTKEEEETKEEESK